MPKLALITGSSRGLGRTLAHFLAAQGYALILTARDERALEAVAQPLSRFGQPVYTCAGDVGDTRHRQALIALAAEQGRLDVLLNNASDLGVSPRPPLAGYPLERLRKLFETNVFAPLALVQEALPLLTQSQALVVHISSDAAQGAYEGWGGYGSSKAALELLTRTLAAEHSEVAFVSVDPGDIRTKMHQEAFPGEDISDRPLPEVTLPFWAWLFGQRPRAVSGARFEAQAERWEVPRA